VAGQFANDSSRLTGDVGTFLQPSRSGLSADTDLGVNTAICAPLQPVRGTPKVTSDCAMFVEIPQRRLAFVGVGICAARTPAIFHYLHRIATDGSDE
jgi:hypothetical protein